MLPLRAKAGRSFPVITLPLSLDEFDSRLTIRLVCILPTGSGEVVCERNAAAAAADDKGVAFDGVLVLKKASCAAVVPAVVVLAGVL